MYTLLCPTKCNDYKTHANLCLCSVRDLDKLNQTLILTNSL